MLALGLQGSPRKKGSTDYLLARCMDELAARGARVRIIDVPRKNIRPCRGCGFCEKKGFCVIDDDDMAGEIYGLLREAEIVVTASPVFFYSVTAQLKALIDRSQTLWSRKYRFRLADPLKKTRRGCVLSMGGSSGRQLFDGVSLVARFFFDAIDADFSGSLFYRNIETPTDMRSVPNLPEDIKGLVTQNLMPAEPRKRVLFACRENACRSQIAGAFARKMGGHQLDVMTAGSAPAKAISPLMVKAMAEKGIDLAFHEPRPLEKAIELLQPDIIVTMGCGEECPHVPGAVRMDWDLPDPAHESMAFMQKVRDEIETKISKLLDDI
jgi:protein-tyrosine-phosphatase/NAD(P)H-dependent FMN reductase